MAKKRISKTDAFEIQFYEGLIAKKPDFFDAMALLADLYTKVGRYEDGLVLDEKMYQIDPENPIILYNLACSYSLVNKVDLSFRTIKKAIKCGYEDFDHLDADKDLRNLKKDQRFQKYYSALTSKRNRVNEQANG